MKRFVVRGLGILIGALLFACVFYFTLLPFREPAPDIQVDMSPENIARGKYMAVNVLQCVDCHSERDWSLYGGPPVEPIGAGRACMTRETIAAGVNAGQERFPGRMCIRNITPDVETGIGAWSDGEIIRAARQGVNRDGEGLFPIMPYFIYRHVADDDIEAVVAYLRTLEPVRSIRPERQIDFPLSMLVQLWPEPWDSPATAPDRGGYRCLRRIPGESRTVRVLSYAQRQALNGRGSRPRVFGRYAIFPERPYDVSDESYAP